MIGAPFTERRRIISARTVVLVSHNQPNREITAHLDTAASGVHLVGDVNGTNGIMAAIHHAATTTRSL